MEQNKNFILDNGINIDLSSLTDDQYKAVISYFNNTKNIKKIPFPKPSDGLPSFKGYKANKLM